MGNRKKLIIATLKDGNGRNAEVSEYFAETLSYRDGVFTGGGMEFSVRDYATIAVTSTCGFFKAHIEGSGIVLVHSSLEKVFTDVHYPGKLYVKEPAPENGWFIGLKDITKLELYGADEWKTPKL